jgi:hypothetical protein
LVGIPSSIQAYLYNVAHSFSEGRATAIVQAALLGAFLVAVPKFGYYGGGLWGTTQFGQSAPKLTWTEVASYHHDVTGNNLAWAKQVLDPATPGLSPGVAGIAYSVLGVPPFAAAGLLGEVLRCGQESSSR